MAAAGTFSGLRGDPTVPPNGRVVALTAFPIGLGVETRRITIGVRATQDDATEPLMFRLDATIPPLAERRAGVSGVDG